MGMMVETALMLELEQTENPKKNKSSSKMYHGIPISLWFLEPIFVSLWKIEKIIRYITYNNFADIKIPDKATLKF